MYPNSSNGGWRCRIKVLERQREAEGSFEYRMRRRRRDLHKQRARVLDQLAQLAEER